VHFNDPSTSVTEFLGHFSHDDSPLKLLNVPGSHFLQSAGKVAFVLFPYVPSGHSLHVNCSVRSFYVPAKHLWHLSSPKSSWYVPSGHSSGAVDPYILHLLPLGHVTQSVFASDPVVGI